MKNFICKGCQREYSWLLIGGLQGKNQEEITDICVYCAGWYPDGTTKPNGGKALSKEEILKLRS